MLISSVTNVVRYAGDCRPVDAVSYAMLRGSTLGAQWPKSNAVDDGSFMEIMRRKTSLKFDLPTEAQWEYACRAGTTNAWNSGNEGNWNGSYYNTELRLLGRYTDNHGDGHDSYSEHTKVGLYLPNAWGIYDMHGNVYEWCLDGYKSLMADYEEIDPVGADATGSRVYRGGFWNAYADCCRVAWRSSRAPNSIEKGTCGFRLVCLPID